MGDTWSDKLQEVAMAEFIERGNGLGGGRGTPGGEAGAAGRPPRPPHHSLESFQNLVTEPTGEIRVLPCGCGCWYCPHCCEHKGYNLRARLVPILSTFRGVMMLTLTVDPVLFASPRTAYLYIRERRAISRTMQDLDRWGHLHSRRYCYVLEFQQHTEQPHFHVLVDSSYIPKPALEASWDKHRPKSAGPVEANRPAFGITRFSKREFEGGAPHAARYVTKYLVKTPSYGYPAWVLAMGAAARVPRVHVSRGFWATPSKPRSMPESTRQTMPRSYAERMADCGTTSNLFAIVQTLHRDTGEITEHLRWEGRVDADRELLEMIAAHSGRIGRGGVAFTACTVGEAIVVLRTVAGHPIRLICTGRAVGEKRRGA